MERQEAAKTKQQRRAQKNDTQQQQQQQQRQQKNGGPKQKIDTTKRWVTATKEHKTESRGGKNGNITFDGWGDASFEKNIKTTTKHEP